jgi:hypothetical protein
MFQKTQYDAVRAKVEKTDAEADALPYMDLFAAAGAAGIQTNKHCEAAVDLLGGARVGGRKDEDAPPRHGVDPHDPEGRARAGR